MCSGFSGASWGSQKLRSFSTSMSWPRFQAKARGIQSRKEQSVTKSTRKKLIEVAIPLEAINEASAFEKSIRHGHPSTLHLWWARRPLAACRAVLFAQLVDDPSAWPDRFPTEEAQDAERRRLHNVIERMVPWEASNDEAILNEARWEIARSVAWMKAWVEPVIDPRARDGWRFDVKIGKPDQEELERLLCGTKARERVIAPSKSAKKKYWKASRGSKFVCVLTGTAIHDDHVKAEGIAGRMSARLFAIVAEGERSRIYLTPSEDHERIAAQAHPAWQPEGELANDPRAIWCPLYGLKTFASLFTPRQLVALTTLSDLIGEVRELVLADGEAAGCLRDDTPLHAGGKGAVAYSDAIATYLAFALSKLADRGSSICTWFTERDSTRPTFARQGIPMSWDFAELNTLLKGTGSFVGAANWTAESIEALGVGDGYARISNIDASANTFPVRPIVISTDPPYYDNIGYADLSDFFYVWLRHSLSGIWPDLFRRLTTPKDQELVATPYRHGGKAAAEAYFMRGMSDALKAMRGAATDREPLAIYYAFKQSEIGEDGITSAGWASFLQAVVDVGLAVDGTWPVRTELSNRLIGKDANALASSVVLVCRRRADDAAITTRGEFIRALKLEMPDAIDDIRKAGVGPVDMQQSIIGPGMGVFSRYAKVLESDDSPMSVKAALTLINRVWEEIENELDANFDAETQVALAWYASYGYDAKKSGELNVIANAKNVPEKALFESLVFKNLHGNAALTPRAELPLNWSPATDKHVTVWRCVQQVARTLKAEEGGGDAAAKLVAQMGLRAADAQKLAYRLFEIATRKGLNDEALVYNELAQEWARLEDIAASSAARTSANETQPSFQF
jgi:putative DNA methylase